MGMQDVEREKFDTNDKEDVGMKNGLDAVAESVMKGDSSDSDRTPGAALLDGHPLEPQGIHNGVGLGNGTNGGHALGGRELQENDPGSDTTRRRVTNGKSPGMTVDAKFLDGTDDPLVLRVDPPEGVRSPNDKDINLNPADVAVQRTSGQMDDYTVNTDVQRHPEPSTSPRQDKDKILKLSPAKIHELTSSPESLCLRAVPPERDRRQTIGSPQSNPEFISREYYDGIRANMANGSGVNGIGIEGAGLDALKRRKSGGGGKPVRLDERPDFRGESNNSSKPSVGGGEHISRTFSTPGSSHRRPSPSAVDREAHPRSKRPKADRRHVPDHLHLEPGKTGQDPFSSTERANPPSPVPMSIPLPPFSVPTHLQLELSSERPSPLYIHQSITKDFPYESSHVKLERLQNFLLLPLSLEKALWFGTLACLDSWLYSFTILPLRFGKSISILLQSWAINLSAEVEYISRFVINGVGRVWRRQRSGSISEHVKQAQGPGDTEPNKSNSSASTTEAFVKNDISSFEREARDRSDTGRRRRGSTVRQHRRTRSVPSALLPGDKADILKGLLMIFTCVTLMYFDASRVYHWIRGQAAIKLYVIYNVLEVGDRLLSAIGQDVLECLFSREALERKPDGRSKVVRPFWLFVIALIYTIVHATALFYQVMTLNVAVNSYSNALITLLLSNQFVEIKSTVFKKFEKENLFQLTCADVVERFQLWLMLVIIACRNLVETGGVFSFGNALTTFAGSTPSPSTNNTPPSTTSILPQSFTLFPSSIFSSLSNVNSFLPTIGQLLGPFLVVLGSEMIVDWLKHAYINKFSNYRPSMYGRFLDILTKDYYINAFADQNLNRRLGLPIIPLSCLFFRVSVQTYQMFLTAWLPPAPSSFSPSNTTSLSSIHNYYSSSPSPSPCTSFSPLSYISSTIPTSLGQISVLFQSIISHAMPSPAAFVPIFTVILFLLLYVTLLLVKLVLGMVLLGYAQARYKNMKRHEKDVYSSTAPTDSGPASATVNGNSVNPSSYTSNKQQQQPQPQRISSSHHPAPTSQQAPPHSPVNSASIMVEGSRRAGGWGTVEVGDQRRAWIYADDPEGARVLREREERSRAGRSGKSAGGSGIAGIENVRRYEMVAKRIW